MPAPRIVIGEEFEPVAEFSGDLELGLDEGGDAGGVESVVVVEGGGAGLVGESGDAEGGLGAGEEDLEEGDILVD
jgi:hypothetical protein